MKEGNQNLPLFTRARAHLQSFGKVKREEISTSRPEPTTALIVRGTDESVRAPRIEPNHSRLQRPKLQDLCDGTYQLIRDYTLRLESRTVVLRKGFVTDLGKDFFQKHGYQLLGPGRGEFSYGEIGPLFFDYCYQHKGAVGGFEKLTRYEIDKALHEIMLKDGVSPIHAQLAYETCRKFGCIKWQA